MLETAGLLDNEKLMEPHKKRAKKDENVEDSINMIESVPDMELSDDEEDANAKKRRKPKQQQEAPVAVVDEMDTTDANDDDNIAPVKGDVLLGLNKKKKQKNDSKIAKSKPEDDMAKKIARALMKSARSGQWANN